MICGSSKYMMYQLERGRRGTVHYQGFVLFEEKKSLIQVKVLFPRAHLEVMRGSVAQCEQYCTKDDTFVEGPWVTGTRPAGAGSRTDLLAIQSAVDSGAKDKEIAQKFFGTWTRVYRAVSVYRRLIVPNR